MSIEQRIMITIPILGAGILAIISQYKSDKLFKSISEGRKYRYKTCIINIKHYIEKIKKSDYIKEEGWKWQKNKGYALKRPIRVRNYSDGISLIVDKKGL